MEKQEAFITVGEVAKKVGLSDKRIFQILKKNKELRTQCRIYGPDHKPGLILVPHNLFDDYIITESKQKGGMAGGNARAKSLKRLRKKKPKKGA